MNTDSAIREMAFKARKSLRSISQGMGRSDSFVFTTLAKGSVPKADTLASIAAQCGYNLALIPSNDLPDTAITIDC